MRFKKPFGAGYDHAAHGIGALDVGIVIYLDPFRGRVQIERFGQTVQQFGLRAAFGQAAGEAFARIAGGVFNEGCFFTAHRHADGDAAARAV